jgi:Outer membrane lipoprotein LolB
MYPSKRFLAPLATAFISIWLSACASLAPPPLPTEASELRSGRFSVTAYKVDMETVSDRQSGGFTAEIAGRSARVDLVSPLGQIIARVSASPGKASIETAQGQRFEDLSENADEQVTLQALGLPIPLLGLSQILVKSSAVDVAGWQTEIQETHNAVENGRPKRLKMTWMRQNRESKHLNTQMNPEIGRIVVLVIINE